MTSIPDHTRRIRAAFVAGLVLLALLLPQATLADPSGYSISALIPSSGFYGRSIEARLFVEKEGDYYLCWKAKTAANVMTDIRRNQAGNFSAWFTVPEATRGTHVVFLTDSLFGELAKHDFEVVPTVHVSPKQGRVGDEITIKGYGFSLNDSVPIKFDGTSVSPSPASNVGSWTKAYTIPTRPSGSYVLDVGPDPHAASDQTWHFHITVLPKITISKASGVAGDVVKVSGTGFAASEKGIQITFDGEKVKGGISAGTDGSFSNEEIVIPRRGSGTYEIGASGFSTSARDVPPVNFTIETGVSASPKEVYVGDEVTVMGSGFAAWETGIKVTFGGRAVDTGSITADRYGTFEASFVVPTSIFGDKTVTAHGDSTPVAAVKTATVKVLARIEVNPLEGSPGDSVTLTGSGFPGDQALTVTFANRAVPETVRSLANGNLSAVVTVPGNPAGRVSVTATGGGAQASDDFTVKEKILPTPQPVSPEEGRRLRSGDVTFQWGRIMGNSDSITYTLEINGPGGSRRITGIEGLSYTMPDDERLQKGDYTWQVKAVDEFGNESLLSDPIPFRVSPIPTWVWVIVGLVVFTTLMTVAYREERLKVTE